MNTTQPALVVNEASNGTEDNSSKTIIYLEVFQNSTTYNGNSQLISLPFGKRPSGFFTTIEIVDEENTELRIQELAQNPHICHRAAQLQDLLFSSTLSEHEALLEAGFCDVIYEPEKYFSAYQETPVEMGLDDSIESVNKVLKDGFSGDIWNIAFTVTPAEIQQYLRSHQ